MELNGLDLLELALSYAKDKEMQQCFEELKKSELELMKVDAAARREKSRALIKFITTVDAETIKLKKVLKKYLQGCGEEEKVVYEKVLKEFETQRNQAVAVKRSLS